MFIGAAVAAVDKFGAWVGQMCGDDASMGIGKTIMAAAMLGMAATTMGASVGMARLGANGNRFFQ